MDARLSTLVCIKITVAKSKEVKTGSNPAESSKQDYGSKRTDLVVVVITG
jgi:hypothetical protein